MFALSNWLFCLFTYWQSVPNCATPKQWPLSQSAPLSILNTSSCNVVWRHVINLDASLSIQCGPSVLTNVRYDDVMLLTVRVCDVASFAATGKCVPSDMLAGPCVPVPPVPPSTLFHVSSDLQSFLCCPKHCSKCRMDYLIPSQSDHLHGQCVMFDSLQAAAGHIRHIAVPDCYTTAVQLLYNCCTTAVQLLYNCYTTAVQLLYNCCTTAVQLLYNCGTTAVQLLYNCCTTAVQLLLLS
jgi:hypothetical protein